jgi:hypothetical protein
MDASQQETLNAEAGWVPVGDRDAGVAEPPFFGPRRLPWRRAHARLVLAICRASADICDSSAAFPLALRVWASLCSRLCSQRSSGFSEQLLVARSEVGARRDASGAGARHAKRRGAQQSRQKYRREYRSHDRIIGTCRQNRDRSPAPKPT